MLNNEDLIKKVKSYNRFLNPDALNKAYNFALEAHKNQKRDEGIPYISHPVAVASILTELKLDSATITTGLLHDTVEDTKATYETVKKEFGKEVADLVDGVTKISALEEKALENSKAENLRKLILATSKDIRVLLVKLADRLHNMRTINFLKDKNKKIRKAKETMEIYAPLADRMGMNTIRDELEDLSFSILNPDARSLILNRLTFIKDKREDIVKSVYYDLNKLLSDNNIDAEIFLDSKKNLGKQLTFANKRQLPVAIICGENEFKDNTVTIKNLKGVKGENNKTFSKKDLINEVKKLI